ncbi:MAG: LuxR C-terminal-related transcriptional regulator [Spirochaetaceae bacterium]|jgi:LuxR family maltose regulon positive regulatory protein|nr:LuxR C-terminal-related transcriptional regulator [Spirochaetaceae bacterium]
MAEVNDNAHSPGKAPVFSGEELYLERTRIHGLLENSLQSFTTTVVAGEGYGKTYAVASFLRRRDEEVIWMQLSDQDNNPWHFWENISTAVSFRSEEIRKAYADMGFPETVREIHRYLELVEAFCAEKKYIIVVDDIHLIHSKPVLNFIEQVLASPLSTQNFVLISRNEPRLNTIPLLSKGRLSRIGAEELRFTKEETTELFRNNGIAVSSEDLDGIHHDTEGWALAVNILAGELKKQNSGCYTRQLLNSGAVWDMIEKNYQRMSIPLRKFLIEISLFDQWPREVLEKIARDDNIITEMEHISSLIRYDAYLHGYHIHRIVLDFLREKQGELAAGDIQRVSTVAAEWCLANNLPMAAARHYARARSYRELINIVFTFRPVMLRRMTAFFLGLVDDLTKDPGPDEEDEDFLFLRYVIRPRLFMIEGRFDEAVAECRASIARFEALPPSPLSSHILCGSYINLGSISMLIARLTGVHDEAEYFIRANYYYMRHPKNFASSATGVNVPSYVTQVAYPAEAGKIEKAIRDFSRAVPHAANCFNGYLYGLDDLAWTEFAYFKDDLDSAEQHARRAIFKAREKKQYEIENRALFYLLRIAIHNGGGENLKEALRQLDAQLYIKDYLSRPILHDIINGWFYAHIGDAEKVSPWLKNKFEENEINSMFHSLEILVKVKYLYAIKRYDDIFAILTRKEHKQGQLIIEMLELTCMEAVVRYRTGDCQGALNCLERAFEAAEPNSLTMPFIEQGDDMRLLTGEAINSGSAIPREWLESIRKRASAYGKKLAMAAEPFRQDSGNRDESPVFFTRRERKILTLLSQGYNRDEIAKETDISVNNVKNSIQDIYRKLRAVNRADAIRIATKHGLLP